MDTFVLPRGIHIGYYVAMPTPDHQPASRRHRPFRTGTVLRLLDVLAVALLLGLTALLLASSVDGMPATVRDRPSLPEHPSCNSVPSRSA
jgi:hypothetical protein